MNPKNVKKLARVTFRFALFLTIFNIFISSSVTIDWSPDTRLTWHDSLEWAPSMTQAQDGRIWLVWHSFEVGTHPDIFYKTYNGSSTFPWSSTERLTTNPSEDIEPSIITGADGNLWVVWSSNRTGNYEIYYKQYDGFFWSPDRRLTNDTSRDEAPSVMQDEDGDVWVAWSSDRLGDPGEIFCSISSDNGASWSLTRRLTTNTADDWSPSIMEAADRSIWLVWVREDNLYYKVFYKNWTLEIPDTPLTEGADIDWHPSIMQAQDDAIWIAWGSDKSELSMDIYCKIYDGFWSEERITYDNANDMMPSIMQAADGSIWIAWTSERISNFDIYYKTDSPPQHLHDMAIVSVTHDRDASYAYWGSNISIEVVPQNQGVEPEDFVVECRANSTLVGSQEANLCAGQLTPINSVWAISKETAPGTYTITANVTVVQGETDAADNTFINGVIQIRIPGDADLSGFVEIPDFHIWAANFGNTPEQCPPDVYPDFDDSGLVEMLDFYVWTRHWGCWPCPPP